jgi:hypothetical protein
VILGAVVRENLNLPALLCYVLTHELIHVSRFSRFMELFALDEAQRTKEEQIVHQSTASVLGNLALDGLDRVLKLFGDHCLTLLDDLPSTTSIF